LPKFAENLKKLNVLLINPSSMPYGELISLLSEKSNLRIPSCGMPLGLIEIAAYLRKSVTSSVALFQVSTPTSHRRMPCLGSNNWIRSITAGKYISSPQVKKV